MLSSTRYEKDSITVERETVTRDGDGATSTGTESVLSCAGDAQSLALDPQELDGAFADGGLRFFAAQPVGNVRPGDDATVTLATGTTITATVEEVRTTGDELVLSYQTSS